MVCETLRRCRALEAIIRRSGFIFLSVVLVVKEFEAEPSTLEGINYNCKRILVSWNSLGQLSN